MPGSQAAYLEVVANPCRFRSWLDQAFRDCPGLFPQAFAQGYRLKDERSSAKTGRRRRRVRLKATGAPLSGRPSFVLPYLTGLTDGAPGPLFPRAFGGPFGAIARAFGKDAMYWCRLGVSPGNNRVVGAPARKADWPEHRLADGHHQPRDGVKNYIATPVGHGGCLGATLAPAAGAADLQAAYPVSQPEAPHVQPGYQPQAGSAAGGAATGRAGRARVPRAVRRRCFLRGWLNIRGRGKLREACVPLPAKGGALITR